MPTLPMPPRRPRRSSRMAVLVVVLTLAATAGIFPATRAVPASASTELVFQPTGDAYVRLKSPTRNYGAAADLRARGGSDAYRSLLEFDVSGVTGTVVSARLRLSVSDASPDGGRV